MLALVISMMTACGTLTQDRNKEWSDPRIAHFPKKAEIKDDKPIQIRKPNLNKLRVIQPKIVEAKAQNKEEANTSEVKRNKDNLNKAAELIEEEKPFDRMNMIMFWLALLSSSVLIWCSVWFVGRSLLK